MLSSQISRLRKLLYPVFLSTTLYFIRRHIGWTNVVAQNLFLNYIIMFYTLIVLVCKDIDKQCDGLCSKKNPSCLRSPSGEKILDKLGKELKHHGTLESRTTEYIGRTSTTVLSEQHVPAIFLVNDDKFPCCFPAALYYLGCNADLTAVRCQHFPCGSNFTPQAMNIWKSVSNCLYLPLQSPTSIFFRVFWK